MAECSTPQEGESKKDEITEEVAPQESHPPVDAAPEPAVEPEPEAAPEPVPEVESVPEPEPEVTPEPVAEVEFVPEPEPEVTPEPVAEVEPSVVLEVVAAPEVRGEPEPVAEVAGAPESATEPEVAAEVAPAAESESSAAPEGAAEPEPAAATPDDQEKAEDFGAMLDESQGKKIHQEVNVGDKISGVLVKVGPENSFIDFGGRSEGAIKTSELFRRADGGEGEMLFAEGDPLEAFVIGAQDEILLSRFVEQGNKDADILYQAYKSGIPVEGKVDAVNKWGLGVTVQGIRTFCPVSQIDTQYVENPEEYRGKTLQFKIKEFRNQGRNIVVSRRALLDEEQKKEADEIRVRIKKDAQLEGRVTRLEDFGAFVDLGAGVEGLVHVSELSHQRVEHPREVLQEGQEVKVAVLKVKSLGSRRKERISLSLKALEMDPWEEASQQFLPGTVAKGKVDALEDYGAFVELTPQLRGMVHVSEMADRRIAHPREVVAVGDEVQIVVLELDVRRRRLRLSMQKVEAMESAANLKEFQTRQKQEEQGKADSTMVDALKRAQLID